MNWLAIVVTAIVGYAMGAIWYGPLFGKLWMKLTGITKKDMDQNKDKMPILYTGGFLVALVMAGVLAVLLGLLQAKSMGGALVFGFWLWLGFVATISFNPVLWQDEPIQLWVLNNTHNLIVILVMTAILTVWV